MALKSAAFLLWLPCMLLFTACSNDTPAPPAPAPETARTLVQGDVLGFLADNGVHTWMAIPYAANTGGAHRWRAPKPVPGWSGTRTFIEAGPRCAQLTNEYDEDDGLAPGLVIGSEDCLTLDIYAPPQTDSEPLPVLVWIHGGGNVWGRSSAYDGSRLAVNENVVVVAVQYRLGPLGWFAHPLIRDSAEQPHDAAASFALLDLIASLHWIRDNISTFGGDPDLVTIAGESHGGYNVAALLASPLATGLFHRAIVQSGGFDSMSISEAQGDTGARANTSKPIVAKLDVNSADELRALPVDEILLAHSRGTGFLDAPRVIEDGVALPAYRLRDAFSDTSTFNAVPMILGTTQHEMRLFYIGDERFIEKSWFLFPTVRDPVIWDQFTGYLTRLWRLRAVDEPAAQLHSAGHDQVYAYRFDWDDGGEFLGIDMQTLFGASHGFEIPFLFNRFEHLGPDADSILFEADTEHAREALSRAIGSYWASFMRTGTPAVDALPEWLPYVADGGSFLKLDSIDDGGIELVAQGGDTLDQLIEDLNEDYAADAQSRCLIVNEMARWMYSIDIEHQIRNATECD